MRQELLTQRRALFCIGGNAKKGTLSQHFEGVCRTSSDKTLHVKPDHNYKV